MNTQEAKLHKVVTSTEAVGTKARFEQAIALSKLRENDNWQKAFSEEEVQEIGSFDGYCKRFVPSQAASTISMQIKVVKTLNPEIIAGRSDELAAIGFEKLYKAIALHENGHFPNPEAAIIAAKTNSLSELRKIGKTGLSEPLAQLWKDKVPASIASSLQFAAEKCRAAVRVAYPNQDSSLFTGLELGITILSGLPETYLLEAAQGVGGEVPDVIAGFDLTVTAPSEVLTAVIQKYIDMGCQPEAIIEDAQSIIALNAHRIEQAAKDKQVAQEADKAKQREALKTQRETQRAAEKADKAVQKMLGKIATITEGSYVVFGNELEGVVKFNNTKAGEQVLGIEFGTAESESGFHLLAKEHSLQVSDRQIMVPYGVVVAAMQGVKTIKKVAKPAAKPVVAGKFSKKAQAAKPAKPAKKK